MNYRDKPAPEGLQLVPEVARADPVASPDRRTWTFRLRSGFRFSDGRPVRASAFEQAIFRTLAPGVNSPGAQYTQDIVGADEFHAGKATAVTGVTARGNTLVVRFKRPTGEFPAQTTMPFFCAVPPGLPADVEGTAAFAGAGPYFVSEYRPGERAILERNRFYGGKRPHHVDRYVVDLQAGSSADVLDRIERGEADWGVGIQSDYADPARGLVTKFGINRSQFFVKPGLTLRTLTLNTSRPLFRDNPRLRRAVNFALDRPALQRVFGALSSTLTDQYLPPSMPGFRDAHIYPLNGPDLAKARSLAKGHTRSGKAVLYAPDNPLSLVRAQIVSQNLATIGIDVAVKAIPGPAFRVRVTTPGEPFDIALSFGFLADYADPSGILNLMFDGQFVGGTNDSRFDSTKYNRLLGQAALLRGRSRFRAYGDLDVRLARDAAPMVAFEVANQMTFVSKRVGCVVLRPALDLTAVCLK